MGNYKTTKRIIRCAWWLALFIDVKKKCELSGFSDLIACVSENR